MSEIYLDVPTVEMAPANTWHELSVNQLMEVKSQLQDKLYIAGSRQAYAAPLRQGIQRIEDLITQKIENPRDDD